jgi:hypothetical protein
MPNLSITIRNFFYRRMASGAGGLASSGAGFAAAAVEEGWRPGLHLSFDDELSSPLPPGISPAMAAMYR